MAQRPPEMAQTSTSTSAGGYLSSSPSSNCAHAPTSNSSFLLGSTTALNAASLTAGHEAYQCQFFYNAQATGPSSRAHANATSPIPPGPQVSSSTSHSSIVQPRQARSGARTTIQTAQSQAAQSGYPYSASAWIPSPVFAPRAAMPDAAQTSYAHKFTSYAMAVPDYSAQYRPHLQQPPPPPVAVPVSPPLQRLPVPSALSYSQPSQPIASSSSLTLDSLSLRTTPPTSMAIQQRSSTVAEYEPAQSASPRHTPSYIPTPASIEAGRRPSVDSTSSVEPVVTGTASGSAEEDDKPRSERKHPCWMCHKAFDR